MKIKPIRALRDYEAALRAIELPMGAKRNTPEGDKLDVLVTLVEAYEAKHRGRCVTPMVLDDRFRRRDTT